MNHFDQVVRFNEAARGDLPRTPTKLTLDQVKLCLRLIFEESFECVEACFKPDSEVLARLRSHKDAMQYVLASEAMNADLNHSHTDLLDGINDTVVVSMGMAALAGLPYNEGMNEVNKSNLAKIDFSTGRCIKDAGGKIQKPEGWKKPDLAAVIAWAEIFGNRGDVEYFVAKPISAALETALSNCGQFPENLA